jgi:hypothetical protein
MRTHRVAAALAVAALAALAPSGRTEEQKWGTIKGQVVLNGDIPKPKEVAIDADKAFCTKNGPVLSEDLVVDPKTKGVRWAMVWLLDAKGGTKIPVNPKLPRPAEKVVLDQPCCSFEPHVLGMRTGQILVAKNSAEVTHNVNIIGGDDNPSLNKAIPAGKSLEVEGWKASTRVVPIQCTIHKWMRCSVWVFDHPYFAVTNEKGEFEIKDAPAGKYRIVIWQESIGWVVMEPPDYGKKGIPIEIKPDAVTDLGKIKLTPEKEKK